jgi:hypothetical protein
MDDLKVGQLAGTPRVTSSPQVQWLPLLSQEAEEGVEHQQHLIPATEAPKEETEPPAEVTESPSEATKAPEEATEAPSEATKPPAEATEPPEEATEAPQEATQPTIEEGSTGAVEEGSTTLEAEEGSTTLEAEDGSTTLGAEEGSGTTGGEPEVRFEIFISNNCFNKTFATKVLRYICPDSLHR